jgi:hypothetical protein
MLTKSKLILSALTGLLAVAILPEAAKANTITGSITVDGAFTSTDLLGLVDADLATCNEIFLRSGTTQSGSGSFLGIGSGTTANVIALPVLCNPVIAPTAGLFSVGGFSVTCLSLGNLLPPSSGSLDLTCLALISDGNPLDTCIGTITADFNVGVGYQITCTAPGSPSSLGSVPDASGSFALLGIGLVALGSFGKFRKQLGVA